MNQPAEETNESNQTLWLLTVAPTIWTAHFLLSYITAAVWCEKFAGPSGSLQFARIAIAIYTVLALVGIVIVFVIGYRMQSIRNASSPEDRDTAESRSRFLGFATVLLAGLSALATIYVALPAVFISGCH